MSTPSDIRSKWNSLVWSHASITALTTKIYNYDVVERSQFESEKFYYQGKVNFFQYLVTRGEDPDETMTNRVMYLHSVLVQYYLEADTAGAMYNNAIDRMATLYDTVESELGRDWDGVVSYYQRQSAPPVPELAEVDGRSAWMIQAEFTGYDVTNF